MCNNTPLVSIIVPNYNHARFLTERFESILSQTYHNFEIIILDDCSTDNSCEVIERYRENPHVSQIVYNEKNCGNTFEQWMRGIELAKGELCWIAESDDSAMPRLLEALVPMLEDEDVSLAVCGSQAIDTDGNVFWNNPFIEGPQVQDGKNFIRRNMVWRNYICNSGMVVFRKSVALCIDRQFMDKKYAGAGDMMFWIEMCEAGKICLVNEYLNKFRKHIANQTDRRELDGTNSRARKHIMNYLLSKKLISWKTSRLLRLFFLEQINKQNGMSPNVRRQFYHLWQMSWIERRFWGLYTRLCNIYG